MEKETEPRPGEEEADAKRLEWLRGNDAANYIREGPAPLRWIDILPVHYIALIWAAMAAILIYVKPPFLLTVLTLVFILSLVPFAVSLRKCSVLYNDMHQYRLVEPLKDSYVVTNSKPQNLPLYRSWARVTFALLDSYVIAATVLFLLGRD